MSDLQSKEPEQRQQQADPQTQTQTRSIVNQSIVGGLDHMSSKKVQQRAAIQATINQPEVR
ncbi:hypothetical protein L0P10_19970, partial [Eggerthella lenta]|nr:hypothetical protein [Eggerthella lenta]